MSNELQIERISPGMSAFFFPMKLSCPTRFLAQWIGHLVLSPGESPTRCLFSKQSNYCFATKTVAKAMLSSSVIMF